MQLQHQQELDALKKQLADQQALIENLQKSLEAGSTPPLPAGKGENVAAISLAGPLHNRLIVGWIVSLAGGVIGLFLSFHFDLPSGAAIVCTFGALLVVVAMVCGFRTLRA